MKTVAVTGSSGFIGKHLINALLKKNYNIIELDIANGIDITDWNSLNSTLEFDVIIHLASKTFVPASFQNPYDYYKNNVISTLNILERARLINAKVIFFSSYLYGEPQYLPIDEKHPIKPHNPYAQSKLICEKICEGYNRDFNLPIVIFRPFNIYGPGQSNFFIIPEIIDQLKKGEIILNDPRPKRDFIYISDIIDGILCVIDNQIDGLEIFNLGSGKSTSIEDLVQQIILISKTNPKVQYRNDFRKGEVLETVADISKISEIYNWAPKIELVKGLGNILNL